jgi:predicted nucleotidyltransferase
VTANPGTASTTKTFKQGYVGSWLKHQANIGLQALKPGGAGGPEMSTIDHLARIRVVIDTLRSLGFKVFIIGARSLVMHGVDIGRETKDWDLFIDKHFDVELRDKITRLLRDRGFKVQWRKWGFYVNSDDVHVDINYAPLTLDDTFISRCSEVEPGLYLPSPEDLLVLKLMSGERKDIDDVKKILLQLHNRLDMDYIRLRARQAGLERELEKILRRLKLHG